MDRGAGRLSLADRAASLARLRGRAEPVVSRMLLAYLRVLSGRVRSAGVRELAPAWAGDGPRRFLCYRNQDVLALTLALCLPEAEDSLSDVDFVCDDSFSGRVTAALTSGLGRQVRWLRRSFGPRARDVQEIIRSPRSVGIAVDTGGPYGVVRPSLLQLARRCQAPSYPIVARVSRGLPFWPRPRMGLPLPGTALAVVLGGPVDPAASDAVVRLQRSLDEADQRAREALAGMGG